MTEPKVILVSPQDIEIGNIGKLEAHEKGLLHRAFSILLFNTKGEVLLQQRAFTKYHSPGLWTNTCCSHPSPNESLTDAVNRRLFEELYLQAQCFHIGSFIYKTELEGGLIEHEFDHVYLGLYTNDLPSLNKEEVENLKWMKWEDLLLEINNFPLTYTFWFKEITQLFNSRIKQYIHENL